MGAKHTVVAVAALATALFIVGCKKEQVATPEPADSPPAFDAAKDKLETFVVGKWCPGNGIDAAAAEKFGLDPNAELNVSQHWIFNADKTFEYGKLGYKDKITGTWMLQPSGISLFYVAWDGEDLGARTNRLKQAEEGGTQAAIADMMAFEGTMGYLRKMDYIEVSEDMKGLMFTTMGGGEEGGAFVLLTSTDLVRMK